MSLEHDPARQRLRGRSKQAREPPDDLDAMSIAEFCRRHSISDQFYYKLQRQGLGPKTIKLGARTLISVESATKWRRDHERKQATNLKTGNADARPGT
jgi:hypothetical protein